MKKVISALTIAVFSLPMVASADFKTICRGANIPGIVKEMKEDVKAKLAAANIPFNAVKVSFIRIQRAQALYTASFADGLSLSSGETPTVSFSGSFAPPDSCDVSAKLKIQVFYGKGARTSSVVDVKVPGSMLFKSNVND
jgi:hypothetical protein